MAETLLVQEDTAAEERVVSESPDVVEETSAYDVMLIQSSSY
jgi:hypothetical protein